jgi:hypothetical protein
MTPVGFGKPTADEEALQDPDIQPSDAWNIPKALAGLGALAPAAILKLFHATDKPSARAFGSHGFDPAHMGKNADYGTPTQGWYGEGMYHGVKDNTLASKQAERGYGGMAQTQFEMRNDHLRPTGGGMSRQDPTVQGQGFKNARVLETEIDDSQLLDVTSAPMKQYYNTKLADVMTGTPTDGRDFIMRRKQWAQSVLDDAVREGKLGVMFGKNEVVIPNPSSLKYRERKVR